MINTTLDPVVQAFKARDGSLHPDRRSWVRHELACVFTTHGLTAGSNEPVRHMQQQLAWKLADNWDAALAELQALGLAPETPAVQPPADDGVAGDGI
jgi:hypothetical protein